MELDFSINKNGVRYRLSEYEKGMFCFICEYELTSKDKIVSIFKGTSKEVEELDVTDLFDKTEEYKIIDL
jgi:hypothetical protein